MTTTIVQLPRTINAAKERFTNLDSLRRLTGWELAATVWAFTYEGEPGRRPKKTSSEAMIRAELSRLSISEFSEQKYPGLTSRNTISAYRDVWKVAMELYGAPDVRPGQKVKLPDAPFPPIVADHDPRYLGIPDYDAIAQQAEADGTGKSKALDIAKNKKAMAAAIKASPVVAAAAQEALLADPERAKKVVVEVIQTSPEVAAAVIKDPKAHTNVVRAQGARQALEREGLVPRQHIDAPEPLSRALTVFGIWQLRKDADKVVENVRNFWDQYVWHPGEKESLIEDVAWVARVINELQVLLTEGTVDDAALAAILREGEVNG